MGALSLPELLIIAGIFILRLGVPLGATLLVTWLLHRLDARWRRQALQRQPSPAGAETLIAAGPDTPGSTSPRAPTPCWGRRRCPEMRRATCPAYLAPELPCWLARLRADGRLPAGCRTCRLFAAQRSATVAG
ncbi:MAG TPA: hypothetical protein VNK95_12110 [Caldilineaceae bacterium]|nr:hypothetical protein [Caldilineaceae bacterium]